MMSGESAYTVYYEQAQGVSDKMNFFVNINGARNMLTEKK